MAGHFKVTGDVDGKLDVQLFDRASKAKSYSERLVELGARMIRVYVDGAPIDDIRDLDPYIVEE